MPQKPLSAKQKQETVDAYNKHKGVPAAARHELNLSGRGWRHRMHAIRHSEYAKQLFDYQQHNAITVTGQTIQRDKDGNVERTWDKIKPDQQFAENMIRAFIADLAEGVRGKSRVIEPPKHSNKDLLAVYPMGDPHFGMYAWAEETGDDFDVDLAEQLTCSAIDRLVESAPPAETAILLELGDFFHADNSSNRTFYSGNPLDVDSRWAKVMQVGLRAMIYCIEKTLTKHKTVLIRIVKGNHDPHSSFALALALDAFFHNNKRVVVDLSPASFWYYKFGKVLIASTHGDTCKMTDLPSVMAADRPEEWGQTKHRYWYMGHIHHEHKREFPGAIVEAFRTLAARDAWHAGQGYRAGRDMCLIVHHKDHGEIERHRCDISMIQR